MRVTDIWFTATNKENGSSFGAKAKLLPGENKDVVAAELERFVIERVGKGLSNGFSDNERFQG